MTGNQNFDKRNPLLTSPLILLIYDTNLSNHTASHRQLHLIFLTFLAMYGRELFRISFHPLLKLTDKVSLCGLPFGLYTWTKTFYLPRLLLSLLKLSTSSHIILSPNISIAPVSYSIFQDLKINLDWGNRMPQRVNPLRCVLFL